mgnify:CR=1 FL=1
MKKNSFLHRIGSGLFMGCLLIAVHTNNPEGATEIRAGNTTYLQYDNTIYQPITLDGRDAYEVVELGQ